MDTIQDIDNRIIAYSKELKLPVFRRDYKEIAQEAARDHQDYETFFDAFNGKTMGSTFREQKEITNPASWLSIQNVSGRFTTRSFTY